MPSERRYVRLETCDVSLISTAVQVTDQIATTIMDPARVERIVQNNTRGLHGVEWVSSTLGAGSAGSAVFLLGHAARTGEDQWYQAAFDNVRAAVKANNRSPIRALGLFSGVAGLAFTLNECAEVESKFRPSAHRLHNRIVDEVMAMSWSFETRKSVPTAEFDVISGMSGLLTYLSLSPWRTRATRVAVDHIAHYLSWLVCSAEVNQTFFQSPDTFLKGASNASNYPRGLVDANLAHGIGGVLFALTAVDGSGLSSLAMSESIGRLVEWFRLTSNFETDRFCVPRALSKNADGSLSADPLGADDIRWCSGLVGSSTALMRAAAAVEDGPLLAAAREALLTSLELYLRDVPGDGPVWESPNLCHGLAGAATALASLGGVPSQRESSIFQTLVRRLMNLADKEAPFVFTESNACGAKLNDPTFLSGAAGVGAFLDLALSGNSPRWVQLFTGGPVNVEA